MTRELHRIEFTADGKTIVIRVDLDDLQYAIDALTRGAGWYRRFSRVKGLTQLSVDTWHS